MSDEAWPSDRARRMLAWWEPRRNEGDMRSLGHARLVANAEGEIRGSLPAAAEQPHQPDRQQRPSAPVAGGLCGALGSLWFMSSSSAAPVA